MLEDSFTVPDAAPADVPAVMKATTEKERKERMDRHCDLVQLGLTPGLCSRILPRVGVVP